MNHSSAISAHFSPPRTFATPYGRFSSSGGYGQHITTSSGNASSLQHNSSPFFVQPSNPNMKLFGASRLAQKTSSSFDNNSSTPQLKPPKPPEKPLTPYMRYYRSVCDKVRSTNPDSKLWDVGKVVGAMWRELGDAEKHPYFEEYDLDKTEYEKVLRVYKNSPAYVAYDQQVQRNKMLTAAKAERHLTGSKSQTSTSDIGVFIQAVDEDDGEDPATSIGHIAAYRYQRNQRLLMEIFSNMAVPDTRTVVNVNRLMHARRQFRSLASHQKNAETELEQIENSFKSKKRTIEDLSRNFLAKIQKVKEKEKVTSEEEFDKLVRKHEMKMLDAYSEYKLKQMAHSAGQDYVARDVAYLMCDMIGKINLALNPDRQNS